MKTKISFVLMGLCLFCFQFTQAQSKTVTGKVTDGNNLALPGANIIIEGTSTGVQTDFDGNYSIDVDAGSVLLYSYIGFQQESRVVGSQSVINVSLQEDTQALDEVVVTALGMSRESKTLSYAVQEIKQEKLNITQDANIKTALAGKIAGVQINGQAGSKLGQSGKIRIRGAISLTSDNDALYVVDGIPGVDPNNIDMENIASLNVLKGPNATALYGQRADAGVVVITTKKGEGKMRVEINSSITADQVAYLPKYQNLYGGGYEGEDSWGTFGQELPMSSYPEMWQRFEGMRYIAWDNNYADESWGPKFDGQEYVPWYAFWPDSPYYGQTTKYEAQPNNIKNFYNTGFTFKNTLAVSGGGEKISARLSYTNLSQSGVTPYSKLDKHFISSNLDFNATDKLTIQTVLSYTNSNIDGNYNDGYGNQTSGSFNSWFSRGVDVSKLRELKDLNTPDGISTSWNWWGPDYYAYYGAGFRKPAFWFNPYTFLERYKQTRETNTYIGSITATYQFDEHWKASATASRNQENFSFRYELPNSLAFSAAPELYNAWINSFGVQKSQTVENNFSGLLEYETEFGEFDLNAFIGGNIRKDSFDRFSAQMNPQANSGGLIIPDLYDFANAGEVPTPATFRSRKQVNSVYTRFSLGYKDMLYLDGTYRKDWSSALPSDNNGYGYPSIGTSFLFSELLKDSKVLTFGKLRAGWAQVGSDVDALLINPIYGIGAKPFLGETVLQTVPTTIIDPELSPALNTSFEVGVDLKFLDNRIGLSATYYNETREDEIISISVPRGSGYNAFLTNAGESQRKGIELTLDTDIIRGEDFNWNLVTNFSRNRTTVNALPNGLDATAAPGGNSAFGVVNMIHELGNNWGQLRGTGIQRDENGTPVLNENGLYATNPNQYLGSVLPDFTGGLVNTLSYKNFTLTASVDFQKGGKFFSLSEYWGSYSGLLEETAAINDQGNNVRDAISDGGGVHVTGVDTDGSPMDVYVDAYDYFTQGRANNIAELFIHNASFIKLRDVSLTYRFPGKWVNNIFESASISLVGRNLALLSVSKDNKHRWDPSELSQTYGENGQVPGTRSYGLNVKINF
ncbi:SusC/RagA family TonB-linked outer membrane protein [Flagellimonas sp.]|jgi:TonB-linked SusC/RagA family outer membrane protein|uniref:SusC/RagA family TonB-linked outer membrane protein n=1 Tax=Flagellimonas sp. TaxID=2058762 RepID=UPI003BA8E4B3